MMSCQEAIDIVKQLIKDNGKGFEWSIYPYYRYDISKDAKHLAIDVLDSDIEITDENNKTVTIAEAFRKSVETEIGGRITKDYVYRLLALALDDDDNGNYITLSILRAVKQYRIRVLGMQY